MLRRWWPAVALALGAALVATAVIVWTGRVPAPTDAGVLPAPTSRPATTHPTAAASTRPGPATSSPHQVPGSTAKHPTTPPISTAARPATVATVATSATSATAATSVAASSTAVRAAAPIRLALPSLGVDAVVDPVESVGGELQVPDDPQRVGWWAGSAPAGVATGSTVLDGHIDSATLGIGAFFHLARLDPGDPVTIRTARGDTLRYTVIARRVYVKADGLPADLFTDPGYPRLVLISCGGTFDHSIKSYEDNVVVFAVPA